MLEIKGIVKRYGEEAALEGVELAVDGKGIYGILGDRGAGKTALARLITGCEDADGGEILLSGQRISRGAYALKRKIRLVPTTLETYGVSTPVEYLDFVGDALGVSADKRYRQIKEALDLCGLEDAQKRPFSSLSRAQTVSLSIAAALIGNPDVIVLDTPFEGIERKSLEPIYELLSMLGRMKTVILFSRKPAEVKELCESVAILSGGKVVVSGRIADIEQRLNATRQTYVTVRGDKDKVLSAIGGVESVIETHVDKSEANNVSVYSVEHRADDKIKDKIFTALAEIGAPMLSIRSVILSLDDVFYSFSSSKKSESDKGGSRK